MARKLGQSYTEALALGVAMGLNNTEASARAGCSVNTLTRRRSEPEFERLVVRLRAEMIGAASGALAYATSKAVSVLVDLLDDPLPSVRLGAARCLLENCIRVRDSVELETRIAELERRANKPEIGRAA